MADPAPAPAPTPGATTTVAGVIGSPVRHSRSPAIVNAAFVAAGLDWTFVAFDVVAGAGASAMAAMRVLGLGGLSVTMPHKQDVIGALDRLSPDAAALRAVNCVACDGAELVGHNTDGAGFVASLRNDEGIDPAGWRCVVVGAGGAARAVVHALADAGAEEVVVVNRTAGRAREAAALAGDVGRVGADADVAGAQLVVNATSVGMGAEPGATTPLPLDPARLHADQVVVDVVYLPQRTPLLIAAERAGARPVDGLGMLVHQAALAIRLWTGVEPDVSVMRAAASS